MISKKVVIFIFFNMYFLQTYNHHFSDKKHDHILKKHKKKHKDKTVSIEKNHEEWEREYTELERSTSELNSPLIPISTQDSSQQQPSLESFYEENPKDQNNKMP